jgi:hypothetical protein
MRLRRVALRSAVVLAAMAAADWTLQRVVLEDGVFLERRIAPFDPPLFSPSQRAALQQLQRDVADPPKRATKFDVELGWCNPPNSGFGEFRYDWAGARIGVGPLERGQLPGTRRIVAVGCSMTHGEEVGARESWCARVDALLTRAEIANLGVAAYGLDQALLRLRRDGWPLEPDEVWLGVLPQAALRVTTLFRPLLDHWSLDVAFKPRFRLNAAGTLELVPNPVQDLADAARMLGDQRLLLDALSGNDPWVARAPLAYAPRGSSWTHRSFAARLVLTARERTGRDVEACFDGESEFARLFDAIVRTMERECTERGVAFRVLVLPGLADLQQRGSAGRGYWEDWVERLRASGLDVVDLASALSSKGGDLAGLFAPAGHYTSVASELIASALLDGRAD